MKKKAREKLSPEPLMGLRHTHLRTDARTHTLGWQGRDVRLTKRARQKTLMGIIRKHFNSVIISTGSATEHQAIHFHQYMCHPSIHPWRYPPISSPIYPSVNPSIHPSINLTVHHFVNYSSTQLPSQLPTYSSIHLSIH